MDHRENTENIRWRIFYLFQICRSLLVHFKILTKKITPWDSHSDYDFMKGRILQFLSILRVFQAHTSEKRLEGAHDE